MKETIIKIKLPAEVSVIFFEHENDADNKKASFETNLKTLLNTPKYINLFGEVVQKAKEEVLNKSL